jgi:phosphatidylinositol glycan class O
LLFLFTGDHGGDSVAEVTAAMFVYSPKPLLSTKISHTDTVNQVDLVPTLATILGLPIPYANLGTVILEALPSMNEAKDTISDWKFALKTLWENVQQTMEYTMQYSKKTNQFSQEKLSYLGGNYTMLAENIQFVSSLDDFVHFTSHVKGYFSLVRQMCEEVWVQFDAVLMYSGLLVTFVSVFFIFLLIDGVPGDQFREILSGTFLYIVFGGLVFTAFGILVCYSVNLVDNIETSMYLSTGILSMIMVTVVIIRNWLVVSFHWQNWSKLSDWPSMIGRILLLLSLCGLFSNSYVVEEARILSYFLLTMAWLLIYDFKSLKPEPTGRVKASEKQPALKLRLVMCVILLSVLVRLSHYYWLCREEQMDCESYAVHKAQSISGLVGMRYCNTQCLFVLIFLALLVTIARIWLRSCGNLVGFSLTVTLARYCPSIIVVCTGGFWILQSLPKDTKFKLFLPWQIQFLPWVIYLVVCVALLTIFVHPLSICVVPKKKERLAVPVYGQSNVIPHLFSQVKELMRGRSKSGVRRCDDNVGKELPIVYGLATAYSSVFVNLGIFVCLLLALLLGDSLAPSVVLMCTSATLLLTILSAIQYEKALYTGEEM